MEAMDDLLLACRSNSLNLFVESFLKMVSTLLECHEPGLQICATNSVSKISIYVHVTLRFGICIEGVSLQRYGRGVESRD